MRPFTRHLSAFAAAAVMVFSAAACSSDSTPAPAASTPVSSPSSSAVTATLPEGLVPNVTEDDGNGPYIRAKLAEDSPLYVFNPSVAQPEVLNAYSVEDLTEMQRIGADYAVEEGLDSIVLDANRVDEWYDANISKFSPSNVPYVDEALKTFEDGRTLLALINNDVLDQRGYSITTDGGPRISDLDIEVTAIIMSPGNHPAVEYKGTVTRRAVNAEGEPGEERVDFTQTYSFERVDGGPWLISGWKNDFSGGY